MSTGVGLLCFAVPHAFGRTADKSSPCSANDLQPGWLTFLDRVHGFCFEYPPLYRSEKPTRKRYLRPGSELLAFFVGGQTPQIGQHGEWLVSAITVIFSKEPFDLKRIVTDAPNGVIALDPVHVGSYTFYYWGPGGGGTNYPDVYFFDLNGKTLRIEFDGHYNPGEKSPDEQTKQIERNVLASFHVLAEPMTENIDWKSMMSTVRSVLEKQFPGEEVGKRYDVGILRPGHIADITGDGIPEALVWLGTGGASTSELALMRIENNKPVVALFKDRQGKTEPMLFLEGASVMHSDSVDLLSKEHAVFHFHFQYMGDGRLGPCDGEAYRWNPHTQTFDYDSRLSTSLTQDFCRKVPQKNQ